MRPLVSFALLAVSSALGCHGDGPVGPRLPPAAIVSQSASPTADDPASSTPMASVSATASAAPSASAAGPVLPDPPPVPSCKAITAHPVEPFEFDGSTSFLTGKSATAGSLETAAQSFIKGRGAQVDIECVPTHVDGEYVELHCSSTWLAASPRFYGAETIAFRRDASGWKRAKFAELFPVAGVSEVIDALCRDAFSSGITSLGLESDGTNEAFLAVVSLSASESFFGVGGVGSAAQSFGCVATIDQIAPYFGCGPVAHLRRPELLDGTGVSSGAASPLAIDLGASGLRVSSVDARQKDAVRAIQSGIDGWIANAKRTHGVASCQVTLDTSEIFATQCTATMSEEDDTDKIVEGLAFRVADGTPIPVDALFTKKKTSLAETSAACVKPYLAPADPSIDPGAANLAVTSFAGFSLNSTTVSFQVPLFLRDGKAPPTRRFGSCSTTLAKLGTSLAELVAFKP